MRPLPLSHTSHAPSSLFCQHVPLTPSVSPRRSHHSLSLALALSHPPPSPPPPSVTLTPFVRSYLWQRWWCHRREEGLAGVQSAVSSACVCTSGQCGNAREKKVTDAAEWSLRVCVSGGEDTRDVGASVACSLKRNHRGCLLVPFIFFLFVCFFAFFFLILASLLREETTGLNLGINLLTNCCLGQEGNSRDPSTMQPSSGSHNHDNCVQTQLCGEFRCSEILVLFCSAAGRGLTPLVLTAPAKLLSK